MSYLYTIDQMAQWYSLGELLTPRTHNGGWGGGAFGTPPLISIFKQSQMGIFDIYV